MLLNHCSFKHLVESKNPGATLGPCFKLGFKMNAVLANFVMIIFFGGGPQAPLPCLFSCYMDQVCSAKTIENVNLNKNNRVPPPKVRSEIILSDTNTIK